MDVLDHNNSIDFAKLSDSQLIQMLNSGFQKSLEKELLLELDKRNLKLFDIETDSIIDNTSVENLQHLSNQKLELYRKILSVVFPLMFGPYLLFFTAVFSVYKQKQKEYWRYTMLGLFMYLVIFVVYVSWVL